MKQLSRSFAALAAIAMAGTRAHAAPAPAPIAASAPAAPRVVEVASSRIHFRDLGIAGAVVPDVDLGPAPALGATRTIDREEIARALTAANATSIPKLPAQLRITRRARRLTTADVDRMVRAGIETARLPRGATVTTVRGAATQVPEGFDRVTVDLPSLPRRAGHVTVTAAVSFVSESDVLARITVPIDFDVPAEALIPDVAKGAAIQLMVRRGLVEVSIGAVAAADGDTGGVLPVMLKPSGRVVRARIVDKDHCVSIEES